MNTVKVQQEIIKQLFGKNSNRLAVGKLKNNKVAVTFNGFSAYIIDNDEWLLDTEKIRQVDFNSLFSDDVIISSKEAHSTGLIIYDDFRKVKLKEFEYEKNKVYFDESRFKYFDNKKMSYTYHKNKLFIFEDDVLVGLIMECKYKSEAETE